MMLEVSGELDHRVLLLPPTRRDGVVTCSVLQSVGLACEVCNSPSVLAAQICAGMGVVVLTDALLTLTNAQLVFDALIRQPAWSDAPVILLSRSETSSPSLSGSFAALNNVTVLDRPTSTRSLISAVQAAMRGRRRQYQLRDQLRSLLAAEEALRSADRRKDEFLAMLAHELRNPLAPIRTASELLARRLPPDSGMQAPLAIVKRQISHLTRLVDDLMDVSRITQGRIQLQRGSVDLSSVVTQALESVETLMREKRHRVHVASTFEPLYVDGDNARLLQCFVNLLTNAAKYTDPSGEIRVDLRREQSEVVVSVADNGVGISPELLPRIFELFVQSERSLDRSEGGLGIGLSVVQRLLAMHGGRVMASSAGPGLGSVFEVRLPLVPVPEKHAQGSPSLRGQTRRILVVDDNVDAATSLAELLKLGGHKTRAVFAAKDALSSMATFHPDVVLLDIGLPDMDGYQVARIIREDGKAVRLVALTGYGQGEDIQRARAVGFDAHLVKPVDLSVLERVIHEL